MKHSQFIKDCKRQMKKDRKKNPFKFAGYPIPERIDTTPHPGGNETSEISTMVLTNEI